MSLRWLPAQLLPALAVIFTLLATWHLLGRMAEQAGPVQLAGQVVITDGSRDRAAPAGIELGAAILGQDATRPASAATRHLRIERDRQGAWWASNIAADRRVALETPEGRYADLRRWELERGDTIRVGGECEFVVEEIGAREVRLLQTCLSGPPRWGVWRIEPSWAEPIEPSWAKRPSGHLTFEGEQMRPPDEARRTPSLLLGGRGSEPYRWPLDSVEPDALRLTWGQDRFILSPDRFAIVRLQRKGGPETSFHKQSTLLMPAVPDGQTRRLVVGRTVYEVAAGTNGALVLTPTERRHAFRDQQLDKLDPKAGDPSKLTADRSGKPEQRWFIGGSETRRPPYTVASGIAWMKAAVLGLALARVPVGLACIAGALARSMPGLARPAGWWGRLALARRLAVASLVSPPRHLILGLLALTMTLMLVVTDAIWAGEQADRLVLAELTLLALGTTSLMLLLAGRLRGYAGWLWALALALGCAGLLAQAQLAFGASSTRWLERVDSHLLGLARIAAAVALLASLRVEPLLAWAACLVRQAGWSWGLLRFTLPVLALLLSVLEFVRGGIIAAEAAKIVLVLTLAIALASINLALAGPAQWRALQGQLPMMAATAALAILFAVVPFFERDFSPLLIMLLASTVQLILAGLLQLGQSFEGERPGPGRERWRRLLGLSLVTVAALLAAGPILALPGSLPALLVLALLAGLLSLWRLLRLQLPRWLRRRPPGPRPAGAKRGPAVDQALAQGLVALGACLLLILAWGFTWTRDNPGGLDWVSAKLADRFRVWQDPWQHPDAAFQLLSGFEQIRTAPVGLGEIRLGENPSGLQSVARIEDDLIGAFLLARFGSVPALAVMALQALLVAHTYAVGLMAWRSRPGDGADRAARQGLALATMGVGTLWLLQALLPWCNALGLLPLMGQSMTWLAYGQSHLLAVGGGGLVVALVTSFAAGQAGASRLPPWPSPRPSWLSPLAKLQAR